MHKAMRKESDLLGQAEVPADALYGIQSQRARENFPLNGQRCLGDFPAMVKALGKQCRFFCAGIYGTFSCRCPNPNGKMCKGFTDQPGEKYSEREYHYSKTD